jgi:excisionase family DNA binding protein
MSVDDVAEYLAVSKSTVYDQWKTWGLPGFKIGKHLRFRQRNVESWLERQAL